MWLGSEALISSYDWSHDSASEKMTMSVLTFAITLDAILADSRAAEDEEYRSDSAVKGLDCAIGECFGPKNKYRYIAD